MLRACRRVVGPTLLLVLLLGATCFGEERQTRPAVAGSFQDAVNRVMAGQRGAAVVLGVESGKLLAHYRLEVAGQKLAHPGSTVKPFTLLALLETSKLDPSTTLRCKRRLDLAGRRLDCTHVEVIEPLDPVAALAYSCNYYFAHFGRLLGDSELAEKLRRAGLSSRTGLAEDEAIGTVRNPRTAEERQLLALGEAGIEVTPLELLMAYRQLALERQRFAGTGILAPVFAGLEASTLYGTGQLARPEGLVVAGKTGTASSQEGAWTHAWFAGYAPAEHPEIVVVVFLERGRGGTEAAPLAREIFTAWWSLRGAP